MTKPKKKPWLAGLLSLLIIGMGQIYNKKYKEGILLYIVGVIFSIFALTNNWLYLILISIWIYTIYDAYSSAKKTITEEPHKHAVKIAIVIFIAEFAVGFLYGFWAGFTSVSEKQAEIQSKLDELDRMSKRFLSELNEVTASLSAYDTITTRNKISEVKLELIDLTTTWKSYCRWPDENRGFIPDYESTKKMCDGYTSLYEICFPKFFDSLYSYTYLLETLKKVGEVPLSERQTAIEDYKTKCNRWLSDYNVVRGSCDTISNMYNLNVTFPDFSKICEIG